MDDADRAQAYEEMDRAIALRNSLAGEASGEAQIVTADGVVCCDCSAPIGGDRLGIVPKAVRCVGCQEVREAEEKRYE
ncbi:TraR/DksA C4-type zinc finger protein [Methylocaldum sp.]|uniref:TraR/DksA C4-type zinc finger protein n=1 Tax=Methylocaldum sp. TaxID=1969727 RepID=UPI002D3CB9F2|nr:hypothetical protein [Methylocaldum sp.]HYE35471.1 hypothetical protein [Methylocaldum sp.]